MEFWQMVVLAVVEGITEYLPVSSTGHMIIASSLMGIQSDPFTKAMTVMIQAGAIFSVLVLYRSRFLKSKYIYIKLLIAFLPAAVIGFLLNDIIDQMLESVTTVAVTLIIGGILLILTDKWLDKRQNNLAEPDYKASLLIGFFQCIAMIPGVSRSAATIWGGLFTGMDRKSAAEFSFLLGVPTLFAATIYKGYKILPTLSSEHIELLLIGNFISFFVAMAAIRSFVDFVSKNGFKVFGYYRVAVGLLILTLQYFLNYDLKVL